ncbi:hypothetical protein ABC383_04945 [Noviherbaspirillum sp. 1P10PC]|uniref:hypothetical protein n=1 Tax=Noviherbaspirillum sp. 1P10PC TaxID=3132292 RepID=UPI0039A258AC
MIEAHSDHEPHPSVAASNAPRSASALMALQPKGSCWYCDQPVDSVRRFCSSNCRDDYLEEEAEFGSGN